MSDDGSWLRQHMLPDDPLKAKEFYRTRLIPKYYSGIFHFIFVSVVGWSVVGFEFSRVSGLKAWELSLAPLTFLYANLVEYIAHRWPMHRRFKGLSIIFERHTLQHHSVLTSDSFEVESTRDLKMVLFPSYFIVALTVGFGLPAAFLARYAVSPNAAHIVGGTAMLYFLNYEWLHLCYHLPAKLLWGVSGAPGLGRLRELHRHHHDRGLMTRYNFNITYPICDLLFGTYYRGPAHARQGAAELAAVPADPGRRRAIKLGIFGLIALGASGSAVQWMRNAGRAPLGERGYAALRQQDREVLLALTPVVLARELPSGESRSAALEHVLASIDGLIARMSVPTRRDFWKLMDLLSFAPTRTLLSDVRGSWSEAGSAELESTLEKWRSSRLGTFNYIYCALIQLAHLGWYGSPESWGPTGYPGPPHL